MIILSGDIGGTHTRIALNRFDSRGNIEVLQWADYASSSHATLEELLHHFIAQHPAKIVGACFAVAGPIVNGAVKLTNLPWTVTLDQLRDSLSLKQVALINDFAAIGYGLASLQESEMVTLQTGDSTVTSTVQAYIGAGTGLGVGFVTTSAGRREVHTTEGGHIDFAPTNTIQIELLNFLLQRHHRVSYERVLSGQGLVNIYQFILAQQYHNQPADQVLEQELAHQWPTGAAAISQAALERHDPAALTAVELLVQIYGAAVGNLALTTLPYGGLYVVGGIAPKLLPLIQSKLFMASFSDKGRMAGLLQHIPLRVVLCTEVGMRGAALYGYQLCQQSPRDC